MNKTMHAIGHGRLALPILLIIVGYFFIPALRTPVGAPMPGELWMYIAGSLLVLFAWIISELLVMASRNTSIRALQIDAVCSAAMTTIVGWVFGFYLFCEILGISQYPLEWWIIVPQFGCMLDAFLSALLAINNAAQKPFGAAGRSNQS